MKFLLCLNITLFLWIYKIINLGVKAHQDLNKFNGLILVIVLAMFFLVELLLLFVFY